MNFSISKEEMTCYFCQGITLEKAKETTGALTQILFATPSGKPWAEIVLII